MDSSRLTGPGVGAVKYDIITALSIAGLNGDTGFQISMTRLISLITARYNWRRDALTMGQREMADLWGVGERTAKREVKRWLECGVLTCHRPGVRGRVASYRLNIGRVCDLTRDIWEQVGSDFAERMTLLAPGGGQVVQLEAIRATRSVSPPSGVGGWEAASEALADRYPMQHDAWIMPLNAFEEEGRLILEARSSFAAEYVKTHFGRDIHEAVQAAWDKPVTVVIRGAHRLRNG